jgi:DNA-binding transcriptional regulator YiaG
MFNLLGSVAQFEREIIGRKPTVQADEIRRLRTEERLSNAEIARRLNVHRSNVGGVLKLA